MAVKYFGTLCVLLVIVLVLNKVRIGSAGFFHSSNSDFGSLLTSGNHAPVYTVYSRHLNQPNFFSPPATSPLPKTLTVTYNSQPSNGGWGSSDSQSSSQQNDNSQGWGRPEPVSQGWGRPEPASQGWGPPEPVSQGWGRPESDSQPQNSPQQKSVSPGFFQNTDLVRELPIIPESKTGKNKNTKNNKKKPKTPSATEDAEVIENDAETPAASSGRLRSSPRNKVQGRSGKLRSSNRTPKSRKNSRPTTFERQEVSDDPSEDDTASAADPAEDQDIPREDDSPESNPPSQDEPLPEEINPDEDDQGAPAPQPRPSKSGRRNKVNPISSSNSPNDGDIPNRESLEEAIQILVRVASQLQQNPNNGGDSFFGGRNNGNNPSQGYGAPSGGYGGASNQNQFQSGSGGYGGASNQNQFQSGSGGYGDRQVRNTGNFRAQPTQLQQRSNGISAANGQFDIVKALASELQTQRF